MIDKVIIAEDQESANLSVQRTMEDMHIKHIDHVFYCDDALNKIMVAKQKGQPYDLLITDLYFESDGTAQKIAGGFDLITEIKKIQPEILILIFSAEKRPATIEMLFNNYEIDGYVRKARNDAKELKAALETLSRGQRYNPQTITTRPRQTNTYDFSKTDISIIRLLSEGLSQKQIADYFEKHNIKPSSLSSIEKKLNQIRGELGFSKNEQLMVYCKEMGII